jgi:hypothetical protein
MKTMKKSHFRKIISLALSVLLSITFVSGKDIQKTFTWKYNISNDASVTMENYDCNIIIHTWSKGEAEFRLTIDAETKTDEDAVILEKHLQDIKFSTSPAAVSFSNRFWESRTTIMNRTTMKLDGGKTVTLTSMELSGELWIPAGCRFELDSKYSGVQLEDFTGPLKLNLYNDNFTGGKISSRAVINDKYGTLVFGDMKDFSADLYNSHFNAGNTADVTFESKYSSITLASCGKLSANAYNDKYEITKTGDVTFTAKYSDLKTESSGNVNINTYEGKVSMKEVMDLKIMSKYTEYLLPATGRCSISSSYNDRLTFGKLTSLIIDESKYSVFRIGYLAVSVEDHDGYNDKFTISDTGNEFKGVNLNGKYTTAEVTLPGSTSFRFKAEIKYADLDINESSLKPIVKVIDGSDVKYDAIKGTESAGMPVIEINGYQMTLKILEK